MPRYRMLLMWLFTGISLNAVTINIKFPPITGLQVVSASDAAIQPVLAPVVRASNSPGSLQQLLPYSLYLRNQTGRDIRAYTLHISFVDAQGKSGGYNRQYFNLESPANGTEINAGADRLVTPFVSQSIAGSLKGGAGGTTGSGRFKDKTVTSWVNDMAHQTSVAISLDLIVFSDGEVVGPDEANTLAYLKGYQSGRQEALNVIHPALRSGQRLAALADELTKRANVLSDSGDLREIAIASQMRRFAAFARREDATALAAEVSRAETQPMFTLARKQ